MEDAIRQVDNIIERRGECIIGGLTEQLLRVGKEELISELRSRGYVIRDSCQVKNGYVVYPKRKKRTGPWMIVQVV